MALRIGVLILLTVAAGLGGGCSRQRDAQPPPERFTYETLGRGGQGRGDLSRYYFWARIKFDDRLVGLVVSNAPGATGNPARVAFVEHDGRRVEVECRGADPGSAKVVIDGQEFDLSAGALLLVTLPHKPARVNQLAVDIAPLADDPPNALKPLAEKHPEVGAFLEASYRK